LQAFGDKRLTRHHQWTTTAPKRRATTQQCIILSQMTVSMQGNFGDIEGTGGRKAVESVHIFDAQT
jgi:hypothetical protein